LKIKIMRIIHLRVYRHKKSDRVNSAGRASYVERNQLMIDASDIVIIHLDKGKREGKPSGTIFAYDYAVNKAKKTIII